LGISCAGRLISLCLTSGGGLPRSSRVSTGRTVSGLGSLIVGLGGGVSCSRSWLLVVSFSGVVSSSWSCSTVTVIVSLWYGSRIRSWAKKKEKAFYRRYREGVDDAALKRGQASQDTRLYSPAYVVPVAAAAAAAW
jgi:hypothetical protein